MKTSTIVGMLVFLLVALGIGWYVYKGASVANAPTNTGALQQTPEPTSTTADVPPPGVDVQVR